jgi:hypothetical protein
MMAFAVPSDGSSWATKSTGKGEGVILQLFKPYREERVRKSLHYMVVLL